MARAIVFLSTLASLLFVVPAGATVDPQRLVLAPADVPVGFRLDRDGSGVRTNAAEVKDEPALAPLFRRWQRVTGYEAQYERAEARIESRVDVFADRAGARQILAWYDREVRKAGLSGLRRRIGSVGAQAWVYSARFPEPVTIVVWRYDRAFAGVLGQGITRQRTLSLAALQQKKLVIALR